MTRSKQKCYHCKFSGESFKVNGRVHFHCGNQELYPDADCISGKVSPWDTLKEWWDTCGKFEPKESILQTTN